MSLIFEQRRTRRFSESEPAVSRRDKSNVSGGWLRSLTFALAHTFMMLRRAESLLQDAGRSREVFIGWVCAVISAAFAALLIWLLYLVAWRNPPEFGVHDLYKTTTIVILGVLLTISLGFSILASRLIRRRRDQSGLLSPLLLRMWGVFFALGSAGVLVHAIVTKSWVETMHCWTLLGTSISMACAAFILARRRGQSHATQISMGQK